VEKQLTSADKYSQGDFRASTLANLPRERCILRGTERLSTTTASDLQELISVIPSLQIYPPIGQEPLTQIWRYGLDAHYENMVAPAGGRCT